MNRHSKGASGLKVFIDFRARLGSGACHLHLTPDIHLLAQSVAAVRLDVKLETVSE